MDNKFTKPNFSHSILNVSATFAEFLGAPNQNATLPQLKQALERRPDKVVYVVFDGMGTKPLAVHRDKVPFLTQHTVDTLTSTFPSTTTCATTTIVTNTCPLQHGWFGWSMHFPEVGRNVDVYPRMYSGTEEKADCAYPLADNKDFFFLHGSGEYAVSMVAPSYVPDTVDVVNRSYRTVAEFFSQLDVVCSQNDKQFVYAYCTQPDHDMHDEGVSSPFIGNLLAEIDDGMRKIADLHKDTLFVVIADHGQIDIDGFVEFYADEELYNMLVCSPYVEARAPAFRVKKGMEDQFVRLFTERYGDDFVLYPSAQLVEQGYFGNVGDKGYLLGDFMAIGTFTHKSFLSFEDSHRFKGHHTSLTEEMTVPLIIVNN